MTGNYAKIVQDNLDRLYGHLPEDLAKNLPGVQEDQRYIFTAFGEKCTIEPKRITLGQKESSPVLGILLSLYALNACPDVCIPFPLKSFKEFPDSMPYAGAFTTHTEHPLAPYVSGIRDAAQKISRSLNGGEVPPDTGGDFALVVYPLPKIALCYIFYEADEDFPASVTCLFSNNANRFMPIDGLADVGEYTSRKILSLI